MKKEFIIHDLAAKIHCYVFVLLYFIEKSLGFIKKFPINLSNSCRSGVIESNDHVSNMASDTLCVEANEGLPHDA